MIAGAIPPIENILRAALRDFERYQKELLVPENVQAKERKGDRLLFSSE